MFWYGCNMKHQILMQFTQAFSIRKLVYVSLPFFVVICYSCNQSENASLPKTWKRVVVDTNPPVTPLSPEESMKKIQLPPGYHVELVASEPMVQEPVAIAWDGNGRMYVAEMNTFMKDANATGEYEPTSRIKLLV